MHAPRRAGVRCVACIVCMCGKCGGIWQHGGRRAWCVRIDGGRTTNEPTPPGGTQKGRRHPPSACCSRGAPMSVGRPVGENAVHLRTNTVRARATEPNGPPITHRNVTDAGTPPLAPMAPSYQRRIDILTDAREIREHCAHVKRVESALVRRANLEREGRREASPGRNPDARVADHELIDPRVVA